MEQVCLGPNGIVAHLQPGALYIDHTTNAPALVRRVHALLAEKGVAMLDAPVSGGMEGAQTRDLLVIAGGDPAAFARARPLFEAIAKRVMHVGGIGAGSVAKILHNSATFTLDLVMAECWTVALKAGVDAATIVDVFNEAALGHMMNLKVRLPATLFRGDFDPRFSLALARKDLGLALDLARATNTPMRLGALCEQEMIEAIGHGWAERDASLTDASLLVNATTLGMHGQPDLAIDIGRLPAAAIVADLVYVPLDTPLLRAARARGLRTADGIGMLLHQAVRGFLLWFGKKPEITNELKGLLERDLSVSPPRVEE